MIWQHSASLDIGLCGVYYLRNTSTGKLYIGMTARSFQARWIEHIEALQEGTHHNRAMQADYDQGHRFAAGVLVALTDSERIEAAEKLLIEYYKSKVALYNVLGTIIPFDHYSKDGTQRYDAKKTRATETK